MTDCALAPTPVPTDRAADPRSTGRSRRNRPAGVPRWLWLLGVAVVPVSTPDRSTGDATRGWVVSAGAGASHVAALFFDEPDARS
jgi:hypothetical protein